MLGVFDPGPIPDQKHISRLAAVELVLVVGEFAEDLREILHVDGLATRQAVEPLHREGLAFDRMCLFGQSLDAGAKYAANPCILRRLSS